MSQTHIREVGHDGGRGDTGPWSIAYVSDAISYVVEQSRQPGYREIIMGVCLVLIVVLLILLKRTKFY